ncbi:unnamed protein product [Urochloa humidicola]
MTKLAILLILLVASSCMVLQVQARGNVELQDDRDEAALMKEEEGSGAVGVSEKQCKYSWETHTGDRWWAGTNAEITFTFYDKKGDSFSVKVDGRPPYVFERDETDRGTFMGKCITVCRVHIESDDFGPAPTWYCDYLKIKVREPRIPLAYDREFDVHQWIGRNSELDPEEADINICGRYGATAASDNTSLPFSII